MKKESFLIVHNYVINKFQNLLLQNNKFMLNLLKLTVIKFILIINGSQDQ